MSPRESLIQNLSAALQGALAPVAVLVNHAERVPESALPVVIVKRRSESRERAGVNVRCELSLQLHILTRGRSRTEREESIRKTLEGVPANSFGAVRVLVDDADFDDEMASDPHETTRLGVSVWYDRAR